MESLFRPMGLFMKRSQKKTPVIRSENQISPKHVRNDNEMTLDSASINTDYIVKGVATNNSDIQDFLFTLGCYEGETITLISILAGQYVIVVKDARYSINQELAECILI